MAYWPYVLQKQYDRIIVVQPLNDLFYFVKNTWSFKVQSSALDLDGGRDCNESFVP